MPQKTTKLPVFTILTNCIPYKLDGIQNPDNEAESFGKKSKKAYLGVSGSTLLPTATEFPAKLRLPKSRQNESRERIVNEIPVEGFLNMEIYFGYNRHGEEQKQPDQSTLAH